MAGAPGAGSTRAARPSPPPRSLCQQSRLYASRRPVTLRWRRLGTRSLRAHAVHCAVTPALSAMHATDPTGPASMGCQQPPKSPTPLPRASPLPRRAGALAPTPAKRLGQPHCLAYRKLSQLERARWAARNGIAEWQLAKERRLRGAEEWKTALPLRAIYLPHIPKRLQVQVDWAKFGCAHTVSTAR